MTEIKTDRPFTDALANTVFQFKNRYAVYVYSTESIRIYLSPRFRRAIEKENEPVVSQSRLTEFMGIKVLDGYEEGIVIVDIMQPSYIERIIVQNPRD